MKYEINKSDTIEFEPVWKMFLRNKLQYQIDSHVMSRINVNLEQQVNHIHNLVIEEMT